MTNEEIAKGNNLIARFMPDMKWFIPLNIIHPPYWRSFDSEGHIRKDYVAGSTLSSQEDRFIQLGYHNDWNMLMSAVTEINHLPEGYHFIIYGAVAEVVETNAPFETVTKTSVTDKEPEIIEAVWKTAVNFIEWYNQQSKL